MPSHIARTHSDKVVKGIRSFAFAFKVGGNNSSATKVKKYPIFLYNIFFSIPDIKRMTNKAVNEGYLIIM